MNHHALINEQRERSLVLHRLAESIAARPFLLAALTLYWTWVNMAFQGPLFFPSVALESGLLFPSWIGPVGVSAVAYFTLGAWFKRTNVVFRQRWYIGAIAAVMACGALLSYLWIELCDASLAQATGAALYALGSLGIGLGTACLLIEWGRVFGYLGPREVLFHGIVAMLLSALLICLLSFLPLAFGQVLFVAIPVPLSVCWYRAMRSFPRKTLFDHGMNATLRTPYKFLVTALLHGLALGVLLGSAVVQADGSNTVLLNALSFVVAALLLLLTAVFVKMDFNHLIYQVGFGIMATGALFIALFGAIPALGQSVQFVGFCYVHLIMWGLCAYLTKTFNLPATWVVALPTGCLMLGQLIGGSTASILVQQEQAGYWMQVMATVVSFVLLMAALLMMSNRNLTTGWGIAQPGGTARSDDSLDAAVQVIVVESGITPREADTLALLTRGRNRKHISEELVVSEETVKSHTSSIYHKLGVHTQQELLDLVEARAALLREAEQETPFA